MELTSSSHLVTLTAGIFRQAVKESGANPLESGGFLSLYNAQDKHPLLLHQIGNPPARSAGLLAFHSMERARFLSTRQDALATSIWQPYCAGAILTMPFCISFASTLADDTSEACAITLAFFMAKDFENPRIMEQLLTVTGHRELVNKLLDGV